MQIIEYNEKYLDDVKDLLVELGEYKDSTELVIKASEAGDCGFHSPGRDRLRKQVKGRWWVTPEPLGSLKTF